MKVWLTVNMFLSAIGSEDEGCWEVSADPRAELPVLGGLDPALALTGSYSSLALCLAQSAVPFTVATPAVISSRVRIQGRSQSIVFFKSLEVRGSLTITDSTLTTNITSQEVSLFVLTEGSINIENSSVDAVGAVLLAGLGSVALKNSNFTNCVAPVVSAQYRGDVTLRVLRCEVRNHTGEFLRISPLSYSGNILVSVEETTFRENQGSEFLLTCSAPFHTGNFTVSNSEFTSNEIPLLYFDIGSIHASVLRSTFTNNSQTSLTVYGKGTVLTIEESLWTENSQTVFDFRQFSGSLQVTGITVKRQRWKGMFQLRNSQSSETCVFVLQESTFLDTYFKVSESSPGLINASGCMILISRTVIDNVRMAAVRQRDLEGLVILRFGDLAISQLTLRSSGSVSMGLGVGMGDFAIADSFLYNLQSGANNYVASTIGKLVVCNVNITHGEGFPLIGANTTLRPSHFSVMTSHLELRNVRVLPGPANHYDEPSVIYGIFSTVNVSELVAEGQRLLALVYFIDVQGVMSNITIGRCVFDLALCILDIFDLLQISNVTISDSSFGEAYGTGLFAATPSLNLDCSDFAISKVTAGYFAASKRSRVRLANLAISESRFRYLLLNQMDSDISIECLRVRRSSAVLAFVFRSSLRIVDSSFEDLESSSVMIGGENVNLTLERVVIKNASSPYGFSRFKEKSQLFISHSTFVGFQSTADEGFFHDTGTLYIANSSFRSFNTVFIQASSCSVYIGNSVFQTAWSKALSRTSASAYGGALGCTDCPSVVVEHSTFLNVSAVFGGAVAVRSLSNLDPSSTHFTHCEFIKCSATAGGAVYVSQSSLHIEESTFTGNNAVQTGGALDIYNSKDQSTLIQHSSFYRNTANEGGAVKWNDAEVRFTSATFQDNSASYGPEVASYGVKLSGSVVSSNGTEASGHPLQLIFELQDHYGQRVATASTQDFQLASTGQVHFLGNTATAIDHGVFNFSQLTVYARPNSTQQVSGAMIEIKHKEMITVNASVEVKFRDCVPGEVRKADRCEYCFAGNVSFSPSDSDCSFCPKHAFCPGGNTLLVDRHYWRNSTNSTAIVRCPLREHCLGGEHSDCAEGYTGQVCNECSEDFSRHRTLECEYCGNRIIQWLTVLLAVVPIWGFNAAVKTASDAQFFILKRAVNHAQLLSVLSFFRVSYPTVISYSLHSLSYISSLYVTDMPISCLSSQESAYIKAIIGSAVPASLCLALILLNRSSARRAWVACTSALMFTPAVPLATQLPLLACQSVLTRTPLLFVHMKHECWSAEHSLMVKALLIPSVIVNVALPAALVAATSIATPHRFENLFPLWRSGVKRQCWDLFMYCSKGLLLTLVIVSIVADQLSQVMYGIMVLIVVSVVAAGVNSYAYVHWKWFFLTEFSLVTVAVSMGLSAYFIYHSPTEGVTDWLITAAFLTLNATFFAVCVRLWRFPPKLIEKQEEAVSLSGDCLHPCPSGIAAPQSSVEFAHSSSDRL